MIHYVQQIDHAICTDNAADKYGVWGGAPAGGWGGGAPPLCQIVATFAPILRVLFTKKSHACNTGNILFLIARFVSACSVEIYIFHAHI